MKPLLLAASLAVLYLSSSAVLAHDDDDHDRRGYYTHDRDQRDRDRHRDRDGDRNRDRDPVYGYDYDYDDDHRHPREHKGGKKKHREYRRGERVEVVYLEPRYRVEDYRRHHLAPPPPGHRWVRHPDGRFLLVAMATGVIADMQHREYRRGERVDVAYLEPRYRVEDYRRHHLAPPPPGHRWVRHPDGRYLLVAMATGVIADMQHREYRRGERVEVVYMEPRYYVEDYHQHRLAPPPPGHRWVRHPDGRYLLVAVATGIIADILLHH